MQRIRHLRHQGRCMSRESRFARRLPVRDAWVREQREIGESYKKHSERVAQRLDDDAIDEIFTGDSTINTINKSKEQKVIGSDFKNNHHLNGREIPLLTYDALRRHFGQLTYPNHEDLSSTLLLADSLINAIIVELNLRHLLQKQPFELSSALLRDIVREIKDAPKKHEILALLAHLYDKAQGKPVLILDFFAKLDTEGVNDLVESFKENDAFSSLQRQRLAFHHYKSGNYHNYENADCVGETANYRYGLEKVHHQQILREYGTKDSTNSSILLSIEYAFQQYEKDMKEFQQDENSLEEFVAEVVEQGTKQETKLTTTKFPPHFSLILSIAHLLLTQPASSAIFKPLMDNFASFGLYNYESMVFKCLPLYHMRAVSLANEIRLTQSDTECIIKRDPNMLATLIRYYAKRKQVSDFKIALSYIGLAEVDHHAKVLSGSFLAGFLAKSKFARNTLDIPATGNVNGVVSLEVVYAAIEGCVEMGMFEYVDALFNKILIHGFVDSVPDSEDIPPVFVLLHLDKDYSSRLLLTRYANVPPDDFSARIFDKQLLKLLMRALCESEDMGRLMWLIPHLDVYIERNYNIEEIELMREDPKYDSHAIDRELVTQIYESLKKFGLEGKMVTYDGYLDFSRLVNSK